MDDMYERWAAVQAVYSGLNAAIAELGGLFDGDGLYAQEAFEDMVYVFCLDFDAEESEDALGVIVKNCLFLPYKD